MDNPKLNESLEQSLHEHKGYSSFWRPNPDDIIIEQSTTFDFLFNLKLIFTSKKPSIIQFCRKELERLQEVVNEALQIEEDE